MAAADSSTIPSEDRDPSDELRDKFDLGFDSNGALRQYDKELNGITERTFQFDVHNGDKKENQVRYEAIGKVIDRCIYKFLETRAGLEKHVVDEDTGEFVFISKDFSRNDEKLLVIIHGSGVVRAGQWSRRLIINDGLEQGSQLPYIKRAVDRGYSVLVMNTNQNKDLSDEKYPGRGNPEKHAISVWHLLVQKRSKARHVAIVAHSYGGVVTLELAKEFEGDFMRRVFSVSLTDSVHQEKLQRLPENPKLLKKLVTISLNFVSSDKEAGEKLEQEERRDRIMKVSAGHEEHEWTSFAAMENLFERLDRMYAKMSKNDEL